MHCKITRRLACFLFLLLIGLILTEGLGPCSGISCVIGCSKPKLIYGRKIRPLTTYATYGVGAVVSYVCIEGFSRLLGSPQSRCRTDGSWSVPTLKCAAFCSKPPSERHTTYTPKEASYRPGSVVTYSCNEGYSGEEDNTMVVKCYQGKWTFLGGRLNCKKDHPELTVTNGDVHPNITGSFTTGGEVICRRGFRLEGLGVITCGQTGQWADQLPTCQVIDCGTPHVYCWQCDNSTGTLVNTTVTCRCFDGVDSFHSVCQTDGKRKPTTSDKCNKCHNHSISNGEMYVSSFHDNSSSCLSSYSFMISCSHGSILIECNCTGNWTPEFPHSTSDVISTGTSTTDPVVYTDTLPSVSTEENEVLKYDRGENQSETERLTTKSIVVILFIMAVLPLTVALSLIFCTRNTMSKRGHMHVKYLPEHAVHRLEDYHECCLGILNRRTDEVNEGTDADQSSQPLYPRPAEHNLRCGPEHKVPLLASPAHGQTTSI